MLLSRNADEIVVKHFDQQNPRFATIKASSPVSQCIPCFLTNSKGKRLVVQAQSAIESSTAVTVEHDDELFLGEVITCQLHDEAFTLEIKVEQVLSGLQSLLALRARLLADAPVNTPGYNAAQTFVSK